MGSDFDYRGLYERTFAQPHYSRHPEGEFSYVYAAGHIRDGERVLDIGSGRGVFLKLLKRTRPNCKLISVDVARFHDIDVEFHEIDITKGDPLPEADVAVALDVLEHIHPDDIDDALAAIAKAAPRAIFNIPNGPDAPFGEALHLTCHGPEWWVPKLTALFVVDSVDPQRVGGHFGYRVTSKLHESPDHPGNQA